MTDEPETDVQQESPDTEKKEMGFLDHLEELRGVLFKSMIAYLIGVIVIVFFIHQISNILNFPLNQAYRIANLPEENLITTRVFEIFNVLLVVCFLGGFVLSLPFTLYFGSTFITPGLTDKEKKILAPGCLMAFLLFVVGACFAFFLILPQAIAITAKLNQLFGIEQYLTVGSYYNTVVWATFATGLTFEFPLVVILLTYIDVLNVQQLRNSRRLVFVLTLMVSALITPGGDPVTLLFLAFPLYGLYELSIMISERLVRRLDRKS